MSELRFNPITRDWVIMAEARGRRPDDFHPAQPGEAKPSRPRHRENCPFCPGNEAMAPGEICRATDAAGNWTVRVVPNKYPAFVQGGDQSRHSQGLFLSMTATGAHEVVVEHPDHSLGLTDMTVEHLTELLRIFRARSLALRELPGVASIVIFKNQGVRAGSSLEHSHSQITAAPVVSPQVSMRLQEARRFHDLHGGCLYCQVMEEELAAGERVVEAGPAFVAFMPFAALSPYHFWIFPRKHACSFDAISDADLVELAGVLSRQLLRLAIAADAPDYNITIRSAPVDECLPSCYHWYLAVVPRMSQLAGFELGSGTYINSLRPEICAERMRNAAVPL